MVRLITATDMLVSDIQRSPLIMNLVIKPIWILHGHVVAPNFFTKEL